jgi:hypothetical protein
MNRSTWPVAIVLAAAILAAGGVLAARELRPPGRDSAPGGESTSAAAPSPARAAGTAAAPETNPTLAKLYAENAVGSCLEGAWGNAGYANMFDQYAGNGVVRFSTGTRAAPTGSAQARTLISLRVYANRSVSDNAALDHWGCTPFTGTPVNSPPPFTPSAPPGLHSDGPLDVGTCQMLGTPGYTSYRAEITIWNPASDPVHMSAFAIQWGSNGILLSEQTYTLDQDIPSQISYTLTASPAPGSATSCVFAGWNP